MSADNRFRDGLAVLTPHPATLAQETADRDSWPWLHAIVIGPYGPGEYLVAVEVPGDTPDDVTYRIVFRDASELRLPDPTTAELRDIFIPGPRDAA